MANDCANAKTQTQLNACINGDFEVADRTLNNVYQRLSKSLSPADRKLLLDAQRAWLGFRDKHCAFVSAPNADGSIYASIYASCTTELTSRRINQLLGRLHCQEGDMGCGI